MFLDSDDRMNVLGIATDLSSALRAAYAIPFDLALVDVRLIERDGFGVVSALTDLDPDLVAVMMSGLDVDVYRDQAFRAGAKGILQKSDIVRRGRDVVVSAYLNATEE